MSNHGGQSALREQRRVLTDPFFTEDDIYEDLRGIPIPLTVFVE